MLKKEKMPARGELVSQREISSVLEICQTTSQDEIEAQAMRGQWWVGPSRFAYMCMSLACYFNFDLTSGLRRWTWVFWVSVLFPMWPHRTNLLFLLSAISLPFFLLAYWDEWPDRLGPYKSYNRMSQDLLWCAGIGPSCLAGTGVRLQVVVYSFFHWQMDFLLLCIKCSIHP